MKKLWWLILLFGVMAAAQWYVPVRMITGSNRILKEGTPMKFRCAPVDPNDPFRGKYIVLQFEIDQYETDSSNRFKTGQQVYIELKEDSLGFARIDSIKNAPPPSGKIYLKANIEYINRYGANNKDKYEINFDLPFRRFYLEESKAPKAEDLYRKEPFDTAGFTYGLVYLLNGEARIKDVIIRDTSILDRLSLLEK